MDEPDIINSYALKHMASIVVDEETTPNNEETTPNNDIYLRCPCCNKILYCFKCTDSDSKKKISYANRKLNKAKNSNVRPVGRPPGTIPKNKLSNEERKTRRRLNSLSKKINSLTNEEREQIKNVLNLA